MDFYSDDSDPDIDEDLREDLDALRRSCILSGADPDAAVAQVSAATSSCLAGPSTPALAAAPGNAASSDDEDDEDEDLALVRSIRANLHLLNKSAPASPLPPDDDPSAPRPICTWPPSDTDEDEDDLETLRAIQRRFSHYQSGTSTASPETMKPEVSQGENSDLFADRIDDEFAAQKQNAKAPDRARFPKAALLLLDALKKNRACQKFIRRKMVNIEAKIEENKDLRDRVKCLLGYQLSCRKSVDRSLSQKEDPRIRLISPRKSTHLSSKNKYRKMPALFLGPAENPHVSKYKMVLKQFPMSFKKQTWSGAEKDKLARGIKQQYQETLILDSLKNGSAIGDFSAVDMAFALTNGAGNFEVTLENLRSVLPLINWDKISAMYLPGRSGAECESRWLNCDDPLINHEAWTADEETRLLLIIQEKGMCNWINTAVTLGTHRTPFQCLVRYQRSLNPHIMNKAWTKEEDLQLQAAVETFGEKWQLVSASLDGRTGNQCSNRWRKTLHPERTRVGRWQLDEDKRLMVSVKLIGPGRWSKIAQFIPGRTQTQCHERWSNILDPDLHLGEWRPEEDSILLASVSEFGLCWSKIANVLIPGRNDSMCYRRWKQLCGHDIPKVKEARRMKKAIFQTNFVDREKERPAIAPSDLISLVQSKGDGCDGDTVRGRSKKQAEENLALSNTLNNSAVPDCIASNTVSNTSSRRSRRVLSGRRSKKQTEENVSAPDDLNDSSSVRSRSRKRKSTTGNNVARRKRMRGSITVSADNEVGTSTGNNVPGRKRMRGSITVSADNEVGTSRMIDSVPTGEEVVVKRRRCLKPVGNVGASRKRKGSINSDNEAGTNIVGDPVSGEEGVVKKRTRRTKPAGTEDAASIGDESIVKQRMGSVSTKNHGGVAKRKRAPSRRKSAEANLTTEGVENASPELDLPSAPSEKRVDAGDMDNRRRKSTPRPKQMNMSEGDADRHSTFTRLSNCLSFARMKGINRNKR